MKTKKIALLSLVIILAVFLVGQQKVSAAGIEEEIFELINQDLKSETLDLPMLWITHSGDGLTQAILAGALYLGGEEETSKLLVAGLTKTALYTKAGKYLFQRPRPGLVYDDVNYNHNYVLADHQSFPSGHTAGAFATATILSEQYPKYSPYFYTYSTLVGISRIYNGVHHPADVVAGAALGYVIGKSTVKYKNLLFTGNIIGFTFKF